MKSTVDQRPIFLEWFAPSQAMSLGDGDDIVFDQSFAADTIHGGKGADIIVTGAGSDWLFGDNGADVFQISPSAPDELLNSGLDHFTVHVRGGAGHDTLVIDDSQWHHTERHGDLTVITLESGEIIRARSIEEFHFL